MKATNTTFTSCPGTFSYAKVFVPEFDSQRLAAKDDPQGRWKKGDEIPLYGTMFLFSKGEKKFKKELDDLIAAAFKKGVAKNGFNPKSFSIMKKPLRDGDAELETGVQKDPIYKGMWFFNANTTGNAPEVLKPLDGEIIEIVDPLEFYSGCIGRLVGSVYPYSTKTKGIGIGLNGCLKLKDGDRLDGRVDSKSAFADFAEEGEDDFK